MKVLCNQPLECFGPRSSFGDIELVTFGSADRAKVDGVQYPLDVCFDASVGTIEELWRALPGGFVPDVLLLWWPDQEPIPAGLERCPARTVGVVSDYNVSLPAIAGLWPFFDVWLSDRNGIELFERLSFADVRYFCQYTFKASSHRVHPGITRDIDVGFAGNLHPVVQHERGPWIARLLALREHGVQVDVRTHLYGAEYGRFLSAAKIGFNRSVRGEANLRCFEVPACGACLFVERENLEIRDFFVPGEEVVIYGDDDLEQLIEQHLRDDARRERIASAGHARVQGHGIGQRLAALQQVLAATGPGRPRADAHAVHLGRANAMAMTWADPAAQFADYLAAHRANPTDPRPLQGLAQAMLRRDKRSFLGDALRLLHLASEVEPDFVPATANLAWVLAASKAGDPAPWLEQLDDRLERSTSLGDFDGLAFDPIANMGLAGALVEAVRSGTVTARLRDGWRAAARYSPQRAVVSCR